MGYAVIANSHDGLSGEEARRPLWFVLAGEMPSSATTSRQRGEGPRRGLHPPSALIASTSAVPSPTIMNPTFQLPYPA